MTEPPEDSKYKWRHVRCPTCGQRYRDFRAPGQPSFREAQAAKMKLAKALAVKGDYSKPCRRAAILGYMHQYKRTLWEQHVEYCERSAHERGLSSSRHGLCIAVP